MSSVEAEGWTIEEAIAGALKQLQAEREQVEIEVLSQGTKGFLGIGGKKARVRATRRTPLSSPTRTPEPARVQKEGRLAEPSAEPVATATTLPSRELGEKACQVLNEMLRLMGIEASLALEAREEELVINITSVAVEGILIGRNGQTLDALEYVINRIVTRSEENEGHIALDAEGYRSRRRKNLEALALRLGERAKRRRKTVALGPLSPRDRRVIHVTLEGDPLVTTRSLGRGYMRRLFIVPEEGARRERGRSTGARDQGSGAGGRS